MRVLEVVGLFLLCHVGALVWALDEIPFKPVLLRYGAMPYNHHGEIISPTFVVEHPDDQNCRIQIRQLYRIEINEEASWGIYDYYFRLEICSSNELSSCVAVTQPYPFCGNNCTLDNEFKNDIYIEFIGEDHLLAEIDLEREEHFSKGQPKEYMFRLDMTRKKQDRPRAKSKAFSVSKHLCDVVQV